VKQKERITEVNIFFSQKSDKWKRVWWRKQEKH